MACIPKHLTKPFLERIKSGEISPEKLADMTSAERRKYFASFLGDANAQLVNATFEQKVLLPARQEGAITWVKEVAGLKPAAKRDILSKIERMTDIMSPEEHDDFMADLVAHKLGMSVSLEESATLAALAKDVYEAKSAIAEGGQREVAGAAEYEFKKYYSNLKGKSRAKALTEYIHPKNWWEAIRNTAGFSKATIASFDISVILRQGMVTLINHPKIWAKNSAQAFVDFANTLKGKDVMKVVMSDALSRENAYNGVYRKHSLAVGVIEEEFPSSEPEKLPLLGKIFKASQDSFTAWQYRTRVDVFDLLYERFTANNMDTEGLGKLVNSMTGRAAIGAAEPFAKQLNEVFFSVRYLRANVDVLTAHMLDRNISPAVRREAVGNMLRTIGVMALVLSIAKALDPDSVEEDPRSSDFGKIKIGNTRFNISGGMAALATFAARVALWSSKSSSTDIITKLNEDRFGARTVGDVILDFFGGKLSPAAGILRDIAKGKDFKGRPVTIGGEAYNVLVPIPFQNMQELLSDPNAAPFLIAVMADAVGIGTNTYDADVDWTTSTGKEMMQFRDKVGDVRFKEANRKYNEEYNSLLERTKSTKKYQDMTDDEKRTFLQAEREKIKNKLFRAYGFKYKKDKKKRVEQ